MGTPPNQTPSRPSAVPRIQKLSDLNDVRVRNNPPGPVDRHGVLGAGLRLSRLQERQELLFAAAFEMRGQTRGDFNGLRPKTLRDFLEDNRLDAPMGGLGDDPDERSRQWEEHQNGFRFQPHADPCTKRS